jgi:hypothetical protein
MNFSWLGAGSMLTPKIFARSDNSDQASRKPHACTVQPGVSSFG